MAEPREDPLKTLARAIVRLEELLERLPVELARDLRVRIATLRVVMLEKRPPALVLVGRRGAGKSSLVNALFGAKVAELGHVTAQTGRGRWYDYERDGGAMSILDTRGVQEGSLPPAEATTRETRSTRSRASSGRRPPTWSSSSPRPARSTPRSMPTSTCSSVSTRK